MGEIGNQRSIPQEVNDPNIDWQINVSHTNVYFAIPEWVNLIKTQCIAGDMVLYHILLHFDTFRSVNLP